MSERRPYNDGLTQKQRAVLREQAWSNPDRRKRGSHWTEKLCTHCREWHKREQADEWCEAFRLENEPGASAPSIQVDKGYFNPNIQVGGAWIANRDAERTAMKLCAKEPKH